MSKLENEMLQKAKNAENHIFRPKMSFLSVFSLGMSYSDRGQQIRVE